MGTQNERLAAYLERNKTINPLVAWVKLGIYRLGARVFDLRKQGYEIKSENVKVQNRFGEDCHVAQYRLVHNNANMHNERAAA